MRWPAALYVGAGLLFVAAGCRSNSDLVEAELRTRDNDLRELRSDLAAAQLQNEALLRELGALRQGMPPAVTPELASQTYTLKQITLGRGTGGIDEDHCPGDEALQVVVEPKDTDDHTIKAPGSLHVEALEISKAGLKSPLSSWDVPPANLRRLWRSGLLSTGYFVVLPWKSWPSSERVRVVARFVLADGRVFEAEKDVTVRLTPAAYQKPPPPSPDAIPLQPALPEQDVPLPAPQKSNSISAASANRPWWIVPTGATATSSGSVNRNDPTAAQAWRPKPEPSLVDSIELQRPTALRYQPGQAP
jgi:hypothetical protein